MSDDQNTSAKLAAAQILSGLYEAIADNTQFDSLFKAMDDFLDADPDGLEMGKANWKAMFREHFERVGQFMDQPSSEASDSPIVHVDQQIVPAAVVDCSYKIVACNELFERIIDRASFDLDEAFSTPEEKRRFDQLLLGNSNNEPILTSFAPDASLNSIFAVATKTSFITPDGHKESMVTIKVAKATWNPDLVPLLDSAYGLTAAELEILEGLVETGSVSDVSKARGRSIRTVRTQLTHIFGKLGIASQTELALFLATLTQLITKERHPSEVGKDWLPSSTDRVEAREIVTEGRTVSYLMYGDPSGTPVLMIHTTTPPTMIPEFRQTCANAGLKMIAVHKPGSGGSTPRPSGHGPEELTDDYKAILDAENISKVLVAGHCSGGLYALAFANLYPELTTGVVLIDTGVPFERHEQLMSLPKSMRRTFLPARYMPEILIVPHRIIAANFKRSTQGEARVVDYFFEGEPGDRKLTQTNRRFYEITRQMIAYSMEDIDRLVADVSRWAGDWSHLLDATADMPLVFLHGDQNHMFRAESIEVYISEHAHASAVFSTGNAQLQIYQSPEHFEKAVKAIEEMSVDSATVMHT